MGPGQSSGSQDGDDLWAKLVPADSRYSEIEIRSQESVVCSETTDSSSEKSSWCEIAWSSDCSSAKIRNLSPNAIIVDGIAIGEEALDIECGSEIISGPKREGYLSYTFQILPTEKQDMKVLKISLDVDHAKCSICLNIWHDVVTVSPCLHNFCNGCFSEWLRKASTHKRQGVVCPQCRTIVRSVGRNHFLHNIEEAILQCSSLRRSNEEIALLDSYASIKSNPNHVDSDTAEDTITLDSISSQLAHMSLQHDQTYDQLASFCSRLSGQCDTLSQTLARYVTALSSQELRLQRLESLAATQCDNFHTIREHFKQSAQRAEKFYQQYALYVDHQQYQWAHHWDTLGLAHPPHVPAYDFSPFLPVVDKPPPDSDLPPADP